MRAMAQAASQPTLASEPKLGWQAIAERRTFIEIILLLAATLRIGALSGSVFLEGDLPLNPQ
jgi:hypothetical protein